MALSPCYRINSPPIIHQIVENEVIIINLETGSYYSLRGSGALIWSLLENEVDRSAICSELSHCFQQPIAAIETSVESFFDRLISENLITAVVQPGLANRDANGVRSRVTGEGEYRPPELESFSDLQNLLLLDPIHQVGPQGWPRQS